MAVYGKVVGRGIGTQDTVLHQGFGAAFMVAEVPSCKLGPVAKPQTAADIYGSILSTIALFFFARL
jgi:hypothetical protein